MQYEEIAPSPALASYIKCFWTLLDEAEPKGLPREKIMPDGCMELIFHAGAPFRQFRPDGSFELQPRCFLYGQISEYIEIGPSGKSDITAVRFYPFGVYPVLHGPVQVLAGRLVTAAALFGAGGELLEQQLSASGSAAERLDILRQFLEARVQQGPEPDRVVQETVRLITEASGQVLIEELAAQQQLSTRQLERKFTAQVGLSPKKYARIVRFQSIFRLLQTQQAGTLTQVAYQAGYYDQAHFIKDFRKFSGLNPRDFFTGHHPFTDLFTTES